ncbi:gluconokinase, GntK/IdnK-type [Erythrobacter sp.]|uniref:gluconokinase n=1 Tax=Erythrobacter sp. TaxID=1042 RepID=UPI0025EE84C8|nr:gluconokinase, GntK/IdnK-type [Erythrobacter sp.]
MQEAPTRDDTLPVSALVIMGPSGSGKSTLARALSARLGWGMIEGDDHHPASNRAKMNAGEPLTEADRRPFLESIGRTIAAATGPVVVACSALRRAHRELLQAFADGILFVWVDVEGDELKRRMERRRDHFMPPSLLADQIGTFDPPTPPEPFIRIDGNLPIAKQVAAIEQHLGRCCRPTPDADGESKRRRH